MKRLALVLLFLPALVSANETIESDSKWAKEYMLNFKHGMLIEYVYKVLIHKKDKVEFYNNCTKEFEYPMQQCGKGYSLVTTIKLPGHDSSLGKGDLQMYFTFNDKQQLVESMHELYYPAHH